MEVIDAMAVKESVSERGQAMPPKKEARKPAKRSLIEGTPDMEPPQKKRKSNVQVKEPRETRPLPQAVPPVSALLREDLTETVDYFRQRQGGVQTNDGSFRGSLLANDYGQRHMMDDDDADDDDIKASQTFSSDKLPAKKIARAPSSNVCLMPVRLLKTGSKRYKLAPRTSSHFLGDTWVFIDPHLQPDLTMRHICARMPRTPCKGEPEPCPRYSALPTASAEHGQSVTILQDQKRKKRIHLIPQTAQTIGSSRLGSLSNKQFTALRSQDDLCLGPTALDLLSNCPCRDNTLHKKDVLNEALCFDLAIESTIEAPYNILPAGFGPARRQDLQIV
ncbi:MAG: hypothetical protein Q9212_002644 [Teloschistes hypoglaucus]